MNYPLGELTDRHLFRAYACRSQRAIFRRVFPNGITPTYDNFQKALRAGLNFSWAVNNLLDRATAERISDAVSSRRWGAQNKWLSETTYESYAHEWLEEIYRQVNQLRRKGHG